MSDRIMEAMKHYREVFWINPNLLPFEEAKPLLPVRPEEVYDAEKRWKRFSGYLLSAYPEIKDGVIESPIDEISNTKFRIEDELEKKIWGRLFLKRDDSLPIAGSVKARGGIYEVLKHAEKLASEKGMLREDMDYSAFDGEEFRRFFSGYKMQVGSTGNLGLSIGISAAKLGFQVIVHMSRDAKQWKKDLLRAKGATVIEYENDYSVAVEEGRRRSEADPTSHFVDDEQSKELFLGYAVGGLRVKRQLNRLGIEVTEKKPLYCYLPCGVGGAPGGLVYGLKLAFGDDVRCFFAEPTHSPCMLLGMLSGKGNAISVQDIGLDNKTEADGLAVGRPSAFVGSMMHLLLSGAYTMNDDRLFYYMKTLYREDGIFVEPSAAAGFLGTTMLSRMISSNDATHLVWATGGMLVPEEVRREWLR